MKTVKTKKMKNSVKDYVKGLVGSKTDEPVKTPEPEGDRARYNGSVIVDFSASNVALDMSKTYTHKYGPYTPAYCIAEDLNHGLFDIIEDNPKYYGADANSDVELHGIIRAVANGAATFIAQYRDTLRFYRLFADIVYEKHGDKYSDPVVTFILNKDDNTLMFMSVMLPTMSAMKVACNRRTSILSRAKRTNAINMVYTDLVSAFVYASLVEKSTNGRSSTENTNNAIPAYVYFLNECRRFVDGFMHYTPSRKQYVVTAYLENGKSNVIMSEQLGSNPPTVIYTANVDPRWFYDTEPNGDVKKIVDEIAAM